MIKVYKNTDDNIILKELTDIENDTWINLINPTKEEIKNVASKVKIEERIIKEALVKKNLPQIKKRNTEF